jgi:hypothetical protein
MLLFRVLATKFLEPRGKKKKEERRKKNIKGTLRAQHFFFFPLQFTAPMSALFVYVANDCDRFAESVYNGAFETQVVAEILQTTSCQCPFTLLLLVLIGSRDCAGGARKKRTKPRRALVLRETHKVRRDERDVDAREAWAERVCTPLDAVCQRLL